MQIGIVGLGRMGANIARRLMRHGHECVVFDANLDASLALGREGATSSAALQDLVKRLKAAARGLADAAGGRGRPRRRWRNWPG